MSYTRKILNIYYVIWCEFLDTLTVECMKRWGLRASFLSVNIKVEAMQVVMLIYLNPNVLYTILWVCAFYFCSSIPLTVINKKLRHFE
jgi:hypothetical protein